MKTSSPTTNAYKKVSTGNTASSVRSDGTAPLILSRPNEKYGATSASVGIIATPFTVKPVKSSLAIGIMYLTVLIGDMSRGILFPTMWLFVLSLGGSKFSQGIAIASFSSGRVLCSPISGQLSETLGHRKVLIVCNIIIVVGTLIYASANSIVLLALGQLVMGIGSGSLGVTRSYIAEHSKKADRTATLAILTAVQYFGFTVTPIFGAILAAVGHRNRMIFPVVFLAVTEFSLPAIFMGCLAAANAFLLYFVFEDSVKVSTSECLLTATAESYETEVDRASTASDYRSQMSMGTTVVIGGCVLNMAMKGTIGVFETLGAEFVTKRFQWDSLHTGYTFATFGMMGVFCLLSFPLLQRCGVQDIDLMTGGSILMTSSCLLLAVAPSIPVYQFYTALCLMYVLGYPLGHTALLGAVSKVCGDQPQGAVMGWFAAAGSLARIIFPLAAGSIADLYGDGAMFGIMAVILLISSFSMIFFRTTISSVVE